MANVLLVKTFIKTLFKWSLLVIFQNRNIIVYYKKKIRALNYSCLLSSVEFHDRNVT